MTSAEGPTPGVSEALGAAILEGIDAEGDPQQHLTVVRRAASAEDEAAALLRQAVLAARGAGHSWAALGAELGMSRQAVQQRFGARSSQADDAGAGAQERWLGPVTAFDEMAELEIAGRQGWRTVGAGMLKHRVRRTATQWEHKRIGWTGPLRRWEDDGWEVAVRAFPWIYLVRDTGRPAEVA
ncbi:hypothetical protein ASG73_02320 [Janibacter sp. Soil728]|uniref:hypothetical protein n=1 Tax=Janibacter sp. Soil728 TaxID=1736393 RepID=UPI0006FE7CE2|nr:hypothetical protein [Janibacter sp. Soil728]KRE39197.1 hypothetical protein ASG73_02320 [Janibacter sp. Soil728]